ncbi:MAG TPA: V-type ATP synthase subunit E [Deltaproteobacteria bacterium]|nr:V-type ATP synthase subunit E [Deltaproteobacteria bacterium]
MEHKEGLERIREAVLAEARTEAQRIVEAAEKAAQERIGHARERIEQETKRSFEARSGAVDRELERELMRFRTEASRRILARQNEILDVVFESARKEVLGWPPGEYARFMKRLLAEAAGPQGGKLRIHPGDTDVFRDVLDDFNAGRKTEGRIVIDPEAGLDERGGFVFVSSTYEVDRRLATVMAEIRHEMTPEIARRLFA